MAVCRVTLERSTVASRYLYASSGRLSRSEYSMSPRLALTSSPPYSYSEIDCSAAGSAATERSAEICRSTASTDSCGSTVV